MTKLESFLCQAIRYEVARRGVDVGIVKERELVGDGWRQEAVSVGGSDVWSNLYRNIVSTNANREGVLADFGCGAGHRLALVLKAAPKQPSAIYATDISERNVADAIRALPGAIVSQADVCVGPLPGGVDLALMVDILEHCEKPVAAVRNAIETLNAGGQLFVSTPNRTWYIAGQQYNAGEPPFNPAHRREWAPWEFIKVVSTAIKSSGLNAYIKSVFGPWPKGWSARTSLLNIHDWWQLLNEYDRQGIRWVAEPEVIAWSSTTVVQIAMK